MRPQQAPNLAELTELSNHRDGASVTIHLTSSPVAVESTGTRIQFRNFVTDAEQRLDAIGTPAARRAALIRALRDLDNDGDFWRAQDHGLVILATPDDVQAFALREPVTDALAVGDRFELGPLLREATTPDHAYLLALTEGEVRLLALTRGHAPVEVPLELPDDLHSLLEYAVNYGDADMPRPSGPEGEMPEQRRYCAAVQDAVLTQIGDAGHPLVLASSAELEPAYRAVSTYRHLLERSVGFNPSHREPVELDAKAWKLLDARRHEELIAWRELFGTRRSNGLATNRLNDVAVAATAAAVDELLFNVDTVVQGSIDEFGQVRIGEAATAPLYNIVDEIAARVLRAGGSVRGVHDEDLLDGSPVAAMLRFPVGA